MKASMRNEAAAGRVHTVCHCTITNETRAPNMHAWLHLIGPAGPKRGVFSALNNALTSSMNLLIVFGADIERCIVSPRLAKTMSSQFMCKHMPLSCYRVVLIGSGRHVWGLSSTAVVQLWWWHNYG